MLELVPKGSVVAEIGVFRGEFSEEILKITEPSRLDLVDIFQGFVRSGDKDGNNIVRCDMRQMEGELIKRFANDPVRVIRQPSLHYLNSLERGELDAVYIDANHTYEDVSMELTAAMRAVKHGGLIMGHDYGCSTGRHDFSGVVKAVDEFCRDLRSELHAIACDGCRSFALYNINDSI